jgi:hypothetical protein
MKRIAVIVLMIFAVLPAWADNYHGWGYCVVFYGGDFDPNNPNANGLANENDVIVGGSPLWRRNLPELRPE